MASIPERVTRVETVVRTHGRELGEYERRIDNLESWRDQLLGATREATKKASNRLILGGMFLTVMNIGVSLYLSYH